VPSNGQLLIGNGSAFVNSTLTAGTGISISNGAGSITINATDGNITLDDGTAAAPALNFTNYPTTGLYSSAANAIGFATSGVARAAISSTGLAVTGTITPTGSVHAAAGSVGNPSLAFNADQDTGLFNIGANNLGVAIGGAKVLDVASTGLTVTGALGASSLTSPASTNLTLAGGSSGASLVLGHGATKPATLTTGSGSFLLSGGKQIFSVSDPDVDGEQIRFNRASDALRYSSIFTLSKGGGLATMSFLVHDGVSSTSQVTVATMTGAGNLLIGGTTDISGTGGLKVFGTTAGSANAGALVVTGGISAGGASYFAGAVTVNTISGINALAGGTQLATFESSVNGSLVELITKGKNSTGTARQANIGINRFADDAWSLSNGTTEHLRVSLTTGAATFAGDLSAQRLEAVDAAANNRAATFIRTQNNTTYSSSVLNIQGDRTTSNSSYNLIAAANGDSSGQFAVRDSGNVVNTNNSYGAISDQKLKENIVDATAKLQKLNQVRIVNFNRIGNGQKQIGVIAQELEQIFPSMIEVAIDRDAKGNDLGTTTKSVKYSVFVPMLIKAVQELTARLAALEAK
jgi:hypothetical protein